MTARQEQSSEHAIGGVHDSFSPLQAPLFDRARGRITGVNAAIVVGNPSGGFSELTLVPCHTRSATALEYRRVLVAFDDEKAGKPTFQP